MTPDAAVFGAQALFGEKYGDEVRVVSMGRGALGQGRRPPDLVDRAVRRHPCGAHRRHRAFVILAASASAAGVRRIEALTGAAALRHLGARERQLGGGGAALKTPVDDVAARVRAPRRAAVAAERGRPAAARAVPWAAGPHRRRRRARWAACGSSVSSSRASPARTCRR